MAHEGSRQARDRGMTRSKAEKARPPTQPVPQVDIVPGRLNEAEWIALMSLEEGEDVVGDILADLLTRVMECAFKVYLTQQERGNPDHFLLGSSWSDRESQEQTQSPEPSAETGVSLGPMPTLEIFQKVEPEDASEELGGQEGSHTLPASQEKSLQSSHILAEPSKVPLGPSHILALPWKESFQPPQEVVRMVGSPQGSAEKGSQLSLEVLYHSELNPDAAGDALKHRSKERPPASASSKGSVSLLSVLTPEMLSRSPQSRRTPTVRLDPARLPRHWVRPVAEVLMSDPESSPLEIYRGRPRGEKTQTGARTSASKSQTLDSLLHPKLPVSTSKLPSQSCAPFRALGSDPTLNLAQSSPAFGSKLPFLSPGFRFLAGNPIPPEVARSPSPKLWPRAKWPSGWEREAEQLGELWAGRTRVPPQGQEPVDDSASEDSGWPLAAPQVLEATSQVLWKPMVFSETMKLVPGVSMWNRGTHELLSPAATQEEAEGGNSPAPEQLPIQTGVSKPQVMMTQLIKKETPKAWLLPAKPVPHSGS
ncbi:uncharacterized protein C2orf81 homolog isoform X2 [Acomys russatus]|uniref:uncharacterized protein C2orf81 homolog isoform X2 n=1 Tax=Acomys russatus TaxID=60746 RepID=UPI0021E25F78|nr:uncharacterized protein C2orf81 homolog isoform X2 [Acomys russatus]